MIIDGEKWACESCVRGHRVSNCTHAGKHHFRQKMHFKLLQLRLLHMRNHVSGAQFVLSNCYEVYNAVLFWTAIPGTSSLTCDLVQTGLCSTSTRRAVQSLSASIAGLCADPSRHMSNAIAERRPASVCTFSPHSKVTVIVAAATTAAAAPALTRRISLTSTLCPNLIQIRR